MGKIIKEIILMLLVILVGILLFAVALYKYIPSKKNVMAVREYVATEETKELLADNITDKKDEIVYTYEVTASDLNRYEKSKEYIPGKSNPFAAIPDEVDPGSVGNTTSNGNTSSNGSTSSNTSTTGSSQFTGTADRNHQGMK